MLSLRDWKIKPYNSLYYLYVIKKIKPYNSLYYLYVIRKH